MYMYMVFLKILEWHRMYYQISLFVLFFSFLFFFSFFIYFVFNNYLFIIYSSLTRNNLGNYHCHDHSVHPIQNSTVHILPWNIAMCDISSQYLILHIINRLSILFYTGNQVDIYINHKAYKKGYNIELSF